MCFNYILNSKKIGLSVVFALFLGFCNLHTTAQTTSDSAHVDVAEAVATETETTSSHKKVSSDPTAAIMEHIADSHDWHLYGHNSFHLPVILYTPKGIELFSSGKLINEHHEPVAYAGKYYTYINEEEHIHAVDANGKVDDSIRVLDFSITKNVVAMFIAIIVILLVFISVAGTYRKRVGKAPKGLQSLIEPFIVFVRDDIAKPNIGYKFERFMPLLLTIFFFIWVNNLLGLIPIFPGGANVTGNIAVTFVLAFIILVVVNLNGNKYYWKHIFLPDVPFWLMPIMWIVEIIGIISKPFALMIRLFANITAGHIIVLSLISLIFIFKTMAIAPVSIAFVLFMDILELLVGFLQAFIFTMLAALFIGSAVEEHHH